MVITNSLKFKKAGETLPADDLMSNLSFGLSNMLSFGLDGVTTTNQKNNIIDFFSSDNATELNYMVYNSGKYECFEITSTMYYVIIEASSVTTSSFSGVNGCVIKDFKNGKWILYNDTGTYEVNRAKVLNTLFYPTTITDATTARVMTGITGLTALKSVDSNDVGKTFEYVQYSHSSGTVSSKNAVGTFSDTTTNTNSQVWSKCHVSITCNCSNNTAINTTIKFPSTTTVNGQSGDCSGGGTSDELLTDTSLERTSNPSDIKLLVEVTSSSTGCGETAGGEAIILCSGTINWTNNGLLTLYNYSFGGTGGIPNFTQITSSDELSCSLVTQKTTLSGTENTVIVKTLSTITSGNTLKIECSFNNKTNWKELTDSTISQITNTGTAFYLRYTITRATKNQKDSIESYGVYYS